MHDVFISYSGTDKSAADAVCHALEADGIRCWIAPRDIVAGKDWSESILTAILNCKLFVLVLSQQSSSARQVQSEVLTAVAENRIVVPLRIEDIYLGGALKLQLSGTHWLDAFPPPLDSHLKKLSETLRVLMGEAPKQASSSSQPTPLQAQPSPDAPHWTTTARTHTDDDVSIFVGKNYEYYKRKWEIAGQRKSKVSLNWAAVLIAIAWMPYRKMYRVTCFIMGATISVLAVCEVAFGLPGRVSNGISSTLLFLAGLHGNYWYKLHVEKKVKEITTTLTRGQAEIELVRQGGTNIGAAIAFLLLYILLIGLIFIVAHEISASTPPAQIDSTECDRLAASPSDQSRPQGIPGVDLDKIDAEQAIPACERAVAQQTLPRLQFQLGRSLQRSRNFKEAARLYKLAADKGLAEAQNNLGTLYENGHGVGKSYEEAARLFKLAADQGLPEAQDNLGLVDGNSVNGEGIAIPEQTGPSSSADSGSAPVATDTAGGGLACGDLADSAKVVAENRENISLEDLYAGFDDVGAKKQSSDSDILELKQVARLVYTSMADRGGTAVRTLIYLSCVSKKLDKIININEEDSKYSSVPRP